LLQEGAPHPPLRGTFSPQAGRRPCRVLHCSRAYQVELHPVDSSVLAAVGYDGERRVLEARFCNGRVYHYFEVPAAELEKVLSATSVGAYFNRAIKPKYRAELVYDPHRSTGPWTA
jgi:KTSC domain